MSKNRVLPNTIYIEGSNYCNQMIEEGIVTIAGVELDSSYIEEWSSENGNYQISIDLFGDNELTDGEIKKITEELEVDASGREIIYIWK